MQTNLEFLRTLCSAVIVLFFSIVLINHWR